MLRLSSVGLSSGHPRRNLLHQLGRLGSGIRRMGHERRERSVQRCEQALPRCE